MRFEYTAVDRGNLAAGQIAGEVYEFIIGGRGYTQSHNENGTQLKAIDGTEYSQLWHIERVWSIETTKISEGTQLDEWQSFLDSISGRAPFVWDRGSNAAGVEVNPLNVVITSKNRRQQRIMRTPNYRYSLTVREL